MGWPQVFSIMAVAWSSMVVVGMVELLLGGGGREWSAAWGGSQRPRRGVGELAGSRAEVAGAGCPVRFCAAPVERLCAAITRRSAAVRGARAARCTAWVTAVRRTSSGVGARET
jgi:hypothetical protein